MATPVWTCNYSSRKCERPVANRLRQNMMSVLPDLTIAAIRTEAAVFAPNISAVEDPKLYRVNNGSVIGRYVEKEFKKHLQERYQFDHGNSTLGVDLPGVRVDIKATCLKKPQSSSSYDSARQKIFGLGHAVLVFAYTKLDDPQTGTGSISVERVVYVEANRTADHRTTKAIQEILDNDGNAEDLASYLLTVNMEIGEADATQLAEELLQMRFITIGYLGVVPAPQWRLNYSVAIANAGKVTGVESIL